MTKNYLIYAILGLISTVFVLILIMALGDQILGLTGTIDDQYSTLLVSGEPMASYPKLKSISLLFGICIISIFLFCLTLGAQKKGSNNQSGVNKTILLGSIFYLGVFIWMVVSWWSYTETNSQDYILGLPQPTAILMFGLLFTPLFFSIYYVLKFDSLIYSDDDDKRFRQIIASRQSKISNQ